MMDNLRHLMAAYFHQDWWHEYDGSWTSAVADFERRSPERVPGLVKEISTLLSEQLSDEDLERRLDGMGNHRSLSDSPTAHKDWLNEILALLASSGHGVEKPA